MAALICIKAGHRPRLDFPHPPRPWSGQGPSQGFTETDCARLLDTAHQQLGGPMVLVWDNLNTHISRTMRRPIAARLWLTVYQLPTYALELNPVEGVWSHLNRSLAKLTKHSLDRLTASVKTRLKRIQYRPASSRASSLRPGSISNRRNCNLHRSFRSRRPPGRGPP
ncbi:MULTISPECIES: transposase [unclassified Streptomyces]|uniref:transposase n=1 Tax=unclassified Streptomyces TaxID=2593676 RepID=UPI0036A65B0A